MRDVRTYRVADIGSDHHFLKAMLKLKLKRHQKHRRAKPYAIDKFNDTKTIIQYQLKLGNRVKQLHTTTSIAEQ